MRFGLSASVFTTNLRTAQQCVDELESGILHVNSQTAGTDVHVPFGGTKDSGSAPTSRDRRRTSSTPRRSRSTRMSDERWLITGALGCIGAWACRQLVREGHEVVAYDLGDDTRRLELVMDAGERSSVRLVSGDITDLEALTSVVERERITHIVHLAALLLPIAKADPHGERLSTSSARSTCSRRRAAVTCKAWPMPAQRRPTTAPTACT